MTIDYRGTPTFLYLQVTDNVACTGDSVAEVPSNLDKETKRLNTDYLAEVSRVPHSEPKV